MIMVMEKEGPPPGMGAFHADTSSLCRFNEVNSCIHAASGTGWAYGIAMHGHRYAGIGIILATFTTQEGWGAVVTRVIRKFHDRHRHTIDRQAEAMARIIMVVL